MELECARRENENVLTKLVSLVPTLHELDIWGDTDHAKKLIVVERKGAGFTASIAKESLSGEVRIAVRILFSIDGGRCLMSSGLEPLYALPFTR